MNIDIEKLEIMDDHVHIFFKPKKPNHSIPKIVQSLKGFSSYYIRNKYKEAIKYKSFWSSSYFIESVGNISESTIKKYIENQKKNLKN